jgi:hypothetical protein
MRGWLLAEYREAERAARLAVNPRDPKLSVALERTVVASVVVGAAGVAITGNSWLVSAALLEILGKQATADIATAIIISAETVFGAGFTDATGVTHLSPQMATWTKGGKFKAAWFFGSMLVLLIGLELGIAYMREVFVEDNLRTSAVLRGDEVHDALPWLGHVIGQSTQLAIGAMVPIFAAYAMTWLDALKDNVRVVASHIRAARFRRRAKKLAKRLMHIDVKAAALKLRREEREARRAARRERAAKGGWWSRLFSQDTGQAGAP